ncbi:MAG: DEAD/DEAH box helicase [Planctomycetes bacterium]|nr:DEAD/DEAH box helicase [Planctomycetota bacterium]
MTSFKDLNLIPELLQAVAEEGYTSPTPIQEKAIPLLLDGKDVLGCAQTGTGKTAAFTLPILQRLAAEPAIVGKREPRCLILAPTRELAQQIGDSVTAYGRRTAITGTTIYGGVSQGAQARAVRAGVDVLVATPGRLLDLMGQAIVPLNSVRYLVLDEADRMLDMGFLPDVLRIVRKVPLRRQTMLFSATLSREIVELAKELLHEPVRVDVAPSSTTVERVRQVVYHVSRNAKGPLLDRLVAMPDVERALVFTRTKRGANQVVERLNLGPIRADVMHADRGQSAREKSLESFKVGTTRVLVATDIASRGLDVDNITHVINFDVPDEPDAYVHRIGRTARAGAHGLAITLCDREEEGKLAAIEKAIRLKIPEGEMPGKAASGRAGGHAGAKAGAHTPAAPHGHAPAHAHAPVHAHAPAYPAPPAPDAAPARDERHGPGPAPLTASGEEPKKVGRLRQRHPRRR